MSRGPSQAPTTIPLLPEASKLTESVEQRRIEEQRPIAKVLYPKGVFFIIVNTFCERFSFNGIRAVLPLYMRNILLYDEDQATVIFHGLNIVCFLLPIIGGVVSDSYLGNFKTILYFSMFYVIGSIVLPIAAIPNLLPQIAFSTIALFIIHVGTGGIKPCIPAFGGEQFVQPAQSKELGKFFSIFYIMMNAGALIAVFVTPILRDDVECFGDSSCFTLAFGVNGAIMLVALVAFVVGKPWYNIKKPHRSIIKDFCCCIWRGLRLRFSAKTDKHDHWLDYASDKYDRQLIEDVKQVLSVIVVFMPMPVFWALYEQQNTRWTFQATRMNGDLGGWVIKPEQMQIVNPIFTILLIPLFDHVIYPLLKKCRLMVTPLQRIGGGLIFCGIAFILSAFVEMSLEPTYASTPGDGLMKLNFINTLPCDVEIRYEIGSHSADLMLNPSHFVIVENLPANETIMILRSVARGENCSLLSTELSDVDLGKGHHKASYSVFITHLNYDMKVFRMNKEEQIEKSFSGDPLLGFFNILNGSGLDQEGEISLKQGNEEVNYYYNKTNEATPTSADFVVQTEFQEVGIRRHEVYISGHNETIGRVENLMQGGVYRVVISSSFENPSLHSLLTVTLTSPNTISILWLLPQIVVMTIAEILFAVTQMTFSFTEAPVRMKSVMQAISLLIIAVGNLIVIIVAEAKSELSQRNEFFLFAGIIGLATVIFALLSMQYKYVVQNSQEQELLEKQPKKK